jgi:hypothetical protein
VSGQTLLNGDELVARVALEGGEEEASSSSRLSGSGAPPGR